MFAGKQPAAAGLHSSRMQKVSETGIDPAIEQFRPAFDPVVNFADPRHLQHAWAFGVVSLSCPVVTLSSTPDGGLTTV